MGATLFNTIVPPNSHQYAWAACRTDCSGGCNGASMDYSNAQSFHPGGVRFVKNSIAMPTWWALGSRADGEVLTSDSY
jgi:hypothetical protein